MEVFKKILIYLGIKKADPDAPVSFNLKMMHGINKISILLFLVGVVYLVGALIVGAAMLTAGLIMVNTRAREDARRLLKASVVYLPVLLALIVTDGLL